MDRNRSLALARTLPSDLGASAPALKNTPSDPGAARLHAMLETAYLAASADDTLDENEIEVLVANLQTWLGESLEPAFLVELFEHLGEQLARDGYAGRLAAVASQLDPESRHIAYRLACVTALSDHDVHDEELKFLGGIADAFSIPAAEAQAIFDQLDEAITAL